MDKGHYIQWFVSTHYTYSNIYREKDNYKLVFLGVSFFALFLFFLVRKLTFFVVFSRVFFEFFFFYPFRTIEPIINFTYTSSKRNTLLKASISPIFKNRTSPCSGTLGKNVVVLKARSNSITCS